MGIEADCKVVVLGTDYQSKLQTPTCLQCCVFDAPNVPDGYYEVSFADQTAFINRRNGCWGLGVPWRQRIRLTEPKLAECIPS